MTKYGIIYKITNKINGKVYIGQTIRRLSERWYGHCSNVIGCRCIGRAIKKYGKGNFTIEEVCACFDMEELNRQEQYFIKCFNSLAPCGYNLTEGGSNGKASKETRIKQSNTRKRFYTNPENNEKMKKAIKEAYIKNPELGLKVAIKYGSKKFEVIEKATGICVGSFISKAECAKSLGITRSHIGECLRGKHKSTRGYIFRYAD